MGYKERRCWANCSRLVCKIFNLCGHDPPTSQTDRQTDRQMTCDGKTVLCTIVHCAVKTNLRRVSNLPSPDLQMLQSFQLQGVLPPDSLLGASLLGAPPQTRIWAYSPAIAMTRPHPPPKCNISWPRPELNSLRTRSIPVYYGGQGGQLLRMAGCRAN